MKPTPPEGITSEQAWLPAVRELAGRDAASNEDRRAAMRIAYGDTPDRAELADLFDLAGVLMESTDPIAVLCGALLHRLIVIERDRLDLIGKLA